MPLTYGLKTAVDLYGKLTRNSQELKKEVSSDSFFDFVVTAYSLIDWIQNDPTIANTAKDELPAFRTTLCIAMCRDLANASKHFQLDAKNAARARVQDTSSAQGYGVGRYGAGGYGVGEESIILTLDDGKQIDALKFVDDVLAAYESFLTTHHII